MMAKYLVYRWIDLRDVSVSKLREVARTFGIDDAEAMTKARLRWAIVRHPNNLSPVPHPLIDVPVDLNEAAARASGRRVEERE